MTKSQIKESGYAQVTRAGKLRFVKPLTPEAKRAITGATDG
jgi:hypothetical protein